MHWWSTMRVSDYVGSKGRCVIWGYRVLRWRQDRALLACYWWELEVNFSVQFCETVFTTHIRENKTINIQKYQNSEGGCIWQAGIKLTLLNKILVGSVACSSCLVHKYFLWSKSEAEGMDSGCTLLIPTTGWLPLHASAASLCWTSWSSSW